jgi:hypothetical protein
MPKVKRIFGVAVKIETTSGTDAVPTAAANSVQLVGIPELEYDFLESGERDDVQTGLLIRPDRAAPAGGWARIPLTVEIKGGGAAGLAPEYDALMRISGHSKTVSAGVSVLYSTLDIGVETATLYLWGGDGKLYKLLGCVAQMELNAEAAKRGFKTFTVIGRFPNSPTQAALPPQTFAAGAVLPPLFHTAVSSIGSWSSAAASDPLGIRSVGINEQITVGELASAGAADGHAGYVITDRATRQTMTIYAPDIASFDIDALARAAGSGVPLSLWQIGTVAGNRMKAQTGRWSFKAPKGGAASGIATYTIEGGLGASAPTTNREINYLYD